MKVICTQENLKRAIGVAERGVGRQGTLPILGNFLLETDNGRLKLSATNLDIGIVARVGAKIETDGRITVPAKLLSNFISNLPVGETITLEEMPGLALSITAGQYQVKIKGLDAQEFPIIPQAKEGSASIMIPAQLLRSALGRLLPCVAVNDARIELTGVNMIFTEKSICLAASDSFRLSEELIELDTPPTPEALAPLIAQGSCVVPSATLTELVRVISPESTTVQLTAEENQLFFEVDGVQIISRLVSGKFPDYKQIIPPSFATKIILDKELFLRAVRIASVFASQGVQEIVLRIRPEEQHLFIESRSQEIGENRTLLKATIDGTEIIDLIFNPRYIIDGINAITTPTLALLVNQSSTPVAFRMINDKSIENTTSLYIVVPIRN
ncbi:MAG: DNA polymerase III subunit beta [Candidatus Moraniibacteriota bacterium]